jgi:N-methylhydantoinase A
MLAGSVALDLAAAAAAADRLSAATGLEFERVVTGVLEVVDAHMERALRAVSVEEGSDPRGSVLVAFGGAGGLHASRLARRLGIRQVLVPPLSGVFSALGLLLATPRADAARTVMLPAGEPRLSAALADVSMSAERRFESMFGEPPDHVGQTADMRYVGQSHELEVAATADWELLTTTFHAAHLERFGFDRPDAPVEVVNLRAVASGEPPMAWADLPPIPAGGNAMGDRGIWLRGTLPAGFEIQGPGVVVEDDSATLLLEGDLLTVDGDGTLNITIEVL